MPGGFVEKVVGGTVVIRVYVKPGSSREGFSFEDEHVVFETREPPVRGKANAALIKSISRAMGIPKSKVSIVSGLKDRVKLVALDLGENIDADKIKELIMKRLSGREA